MKAQEYWMMFMETGAPEMYLMFKQAKEMEAKYVFNDPGAGSSSYGLQ